MATPKICKVDDFNCSANNLWARLPSPRRAQRLILLALDQPVPPSLRSLRLARAASRYSCPFIAKEIARIESH